MSKINLTPNASGTGTLTVTSPNTNSDYTLTLPAVTGTFNTSGAVNEVPAGSNTAPSIYFTGDTNTGIYSPGADSIALTEGGVEGLRLNSSGNVQLAGNLGLGGTTPTTSGTGITFPATQSASTDANTLDDYEEGTFTYTMPTSTSGSYTVRSGYSTGLYTKIGRSVTVTIRYESSGSSSPVGTLQIAGLPFARAANPSGGFSESYTPFLIRGSTGTTASFYGYLGASTTTIQFYKQGTDGVFSAFTVSDVSGGSGGAVEGGISITYET